MRKRGNWIVAVLIALLAAFTIYDGKKAKIRDEEKEQQSKVVHIPSDEISKIELVTRTQKTVLESKDGSWILVEPIKDRADTDAVHAFLEGITGEKAQNFDGGSQDLSVFGLQDPVSTVTLTSKTGKTQTIQFGSVKAYDGSLYAKEPGQDKIRLVSGSWDVYATKPPADFRDKRLYRGADRAAFSTVTMKREGEPELTIGKENGKWKIEKPASSSGEPLSQSSVDALIEQIKVLRGTDFTGPEVKFPSHAAIHLEMKYSDASKPPFTLEVYFEPKGEKVWVKSSDASPMTLPRTALSALSKHAEDFFDKLAPFRFDPATVSRLEIEAPRLNYPLVLKAEKSGKTWALASSSRPGGLHGELDSTKLDDLVQRISKLETVRFLGPLKSSRERVDSKIRLLKVDGTLAFEMEWGPATDVNGADGVEAHVIPVRTSLSDRWLGMPAVTIDGLNLANLGHATDVNGANGADSAKK